MNTICIDPRTRMIAFYNNPYSAMRRDYQDAPGDSGEARFFPRVNAASDDAAYRVAIELPGMKKEEIHIRFAEEVMTVSGERKSGGDAQGEWLHRERLDGKFERRFRFRKPVDASKITALYQDGILTITAPYAAEALPARIEIR